MSLLAKEFLGGLALPLPVIAARIVGATLLCALIGFEREATDHPAGLRTQMLIGLAASVFALITIHLVAMYPDGSDAIRLDPIRLVEAATSGVAFLAAGLIVFSRGRVKHMTTGALLWVSAATGLAAGLGLWPIAIMTAVLAVVITAVLRGVSDRIGTK